MAIEASLRAEDVRPLIKGLCKVRYDRTPVAVTVLESTHSSFTIECRTRSAGWEKATFANTGGRVTCSNGTWSHALTLEVLRKLVAGLAPSDWPELLRSFKGVEALADEAWRAAALPVV